MTPTPTPRRAVVLAMIAVFSVALGVFVAWRSPNSPASVGLVLLGAAPTATAAIEAWGESFGGPGSIPGAHIVA